MLSTSNQVIRQSVSAPLALKKPARQAQGLFTAGRRDQDRALLETLVFDGFHKSYQANLTDFMPLLVGIGNEKPEAVVGIRTGAERFFVETYLTMPVDARLAGTPLATRRSRLAEIGNLYSSASHHTIPLLLVTALALYKQNYEVLVFTATHALRDLMANSGIELTVLADADINALSDDEKAKWGSYYDTTPQVVAVSLSSIVTTLFANPRVKKLFSAVVDQCARLSSQIEVAA